MERGQQRRGGVDRDAVPGDTAFLDHPLDLAARGDAGAGEQLGDTLGFALAAGFRGGAGRVRVGGVGRSRLLAAGAARRIGCAAHTTFSATFRARAGRTVTESGAGGTLAKGRARGAISSGGALGALVFGWATAGGGAFGTIRLGGAIGAATGRAFAAFTARFTEAATAFAGTVAIGTRAAGRAVATAFFAVSGKATATAFARSAAIGAGAATFAAFAAAFAKAIASGLAGAIAIGALATRGEAARTAFAPAVKATFVATIRSGVRSGGATASAAIGAVTRSGAGGTLGTART